MKEDTVSEPLTEPQRRVLSTRLWNTSQWFTNSVLRVPSVKAYTAVTLLLCFQTTSAALFSQYILAPPSRTVFPVSIHTINGTVSNALSLISLTGTDNTTGTATIQGTSAVTLDFGKNIGGIISITVGNSSAADAWIGITFSESSLWISGEASDATADAGQDSPLWIPVGRGPGTYTVEPQFERGAFRYASLVGNTSATVDVASVWCNITFAPDMENLQDYSGWFNSDDELLNRIWYAGEFIIFLFSRDRGC